MQITKLEGENTIQRREGSSTEKDILIFGDVQHGRMVYRKLHFETHLKSRFVTFSPNWMLLNGEIRAVHRPLNARRTASLVPNQPSFGVTFL
jgi:aspartate carbamoyltransferase catalytic subunit